LISHLKNKTPCEAKVSNISVTDALDLFKKKETKLQQLECVYCHKLITKRNMKRHIEISHSNIEENTLQTDNLVIQENNDTDLKSFILKAIDEAMKKYVSNQPSQNIVNNTNIMNITINSFGNENLDHLTHDILTFCLMNPKRGITSLIDTIHYNDSMPMNKNIRYKSTKNNTFEKYFDNQWVECDASNTLDELIRKGYRVLNTHYLTHYVNDPSFDDNVRRMAIEKFRFLGDTTSTEYFAVKRDLRLLIKNKTLYVVIPPQNDFDDNETVLQND
jgi:hypothetical protein